MKALNEALSEKMSKAITGLFFDLLKDDTTKVEIHNTSRASVATVMTILASENMYIAAISDHFHIPSQLGFPFANHCLYRCEACDLRIETTDNGTTWHLVEAVTNG